VRGMVLEGYGYTLHQGLRNEPEGVGSRNGGVLLVPFVKLTLADITLPFESYGPGTQYSVVLDSYHD